MKGRAKHTKSVGNVFADLELPDPEDRMLKARLTIEIRRLIEAKSWTQAEAAKAMGVDQPKVSHLMRGRLSGFSVDRLIAILNRLGHDVEVRISATEQRRRKAATIVTCA